VFVTTVTRIRHTRAWRVFAPLTVELAVLVLFPWWSRFVPPLVAFAGLAVFAYYTYRLVIRTRKWNESLRLAEAEGRNPPGWHRRDDMWCCDTHDRPYCRRCPP